MHTEHVRNLHPGWVLAGWLIAVAVAGAVLLVLVGIGLVGGSPRTTDTFVLLAVGTGFFAGGFFVGLRWSDAPILHGAAITFLSVLAWFLGAVLAPGSLAGRRLAVGFVLGIVLLQLLAAVAGGWVGRSLVRRGEVPTLDA